MYRSALMCFSVLQDVWNAFRRLSRGAGEVVGVWRSRGGVDKVRECIDGIGEV